MGVGSYLVPVANFSSAPRTVPETHRILILKALTDFYKYTLAII